MGLFQTVEYLWSRKKTLMAGVLIGVLIGGIYALTRAPMFVARAVIAPKDRADEGGSRLGQLGGLGSLVGGQFSVGSGLSRIEVTAHTLEVAEGLVKKHDLLPRLFRGAWNPKTRTWKKGLLGRGKPPTTKKGGLVLKRMVKTDLNTLGGQLTLSVSSDDPEFSAWLVKVYLEALNSKLRAEAVADAERNRRYLENQLSFAIDPMVRGKIENLIGYSIEKAMLANDSYFDVLEKPFAPLAPEGPGKKNIVLAAAMLGLLLSSLLLLFLRALHHYRQERAVEHES